MHGSCSMLVWDHVACGMWRAAGQDRQDRPAMKKSGSQQARPPPCVVGQPLNEAVLNVRDVPNAQHRHLHKCTGHAASLSLPTYDLSESIPCSVLPMQMLAGHAVL